MYGYFDGDKTTKPFVLMLFANKNQLLGFNKKQTVKGKSHPGD